MTVVRKEIDVTTGQRLLFSTEKYFFYITNEPTDEKTAREVVRDGNRRCDQGRACRHGPTRPDDDSP